MSEIGYSGSMTTIRQLIALTVLCIAVAAPALAQDELPSWWQDHVYFMSHEGGTWRAANRDVTEDPRSPDHFEMVWTRVNDGYGLRGRLYGLRDGENVGEYWTFAEFWHPGEARAILEQWSARGAYGIGELGSVGEHRYELAQTFWTRAGQASQSGHRTFEDGDTYNTDTFAIDGDGNWEQSGGLVWTRVTPSQ